MSHNLGDRGGSRFIAQAILLQGQNVTIAAQSGVLGGGHKVSDNKLSRNSGIGAAVTYATTPKSATIQPGQILEVRLTEDFR